MERDSLKIGSLVKCIDDEYQKKYIELNKVYLVVGHEMSNCVKLKGVGKAFHYSRFTPIKSKFERRKNET